MDRVLTEGPATPPARDPYADIAELYDIEHAAFDDDVDLYRQFAYATGDPILELACGSGRVLVPLAEDGYRVTGTDRSAAMLDRARTAVAQAGAGEKVTLAEAEMQEASAAPGGPFGLVLVALNGLLHLTDQREQLAVLRAARQAMDPRGQLILDVLNPTPEHLRALEGTALEGTWRLPDGRQAMKFSHRRVFPSRQLIENDIWYDVVDGDGSVTRTTTGFALRYVHLPELHLLLEAAGYVEWEAYGSYDLDPFDDGSDRMIVTAEVTGTR